MRSTDKCLKSIAIFDEILPVIVRSRQYLSRDFIVLRNRGY